jgi:hypothetical protein
MTGRSSWAETGTSILTGCRVEEEHLAALETFVENKTSE